MPSKKKAVVGPQEEETMKKAEALKQAGFNAFGSTEKFDVEKEMEEMKAQGLASPEAPVTNPEEAPVKKAQEAVAQAQPTPPQLQFDDDPQKKMQQVHELLATISDSPPPVQQLDYWKQAHGDVYLLTLDESKVFLFRYIKNQEWAQLTVGEESLANKFKDRPDKFNEEIFDRCVLWPVFDDVMKASLPGGLISTMVELIRIHSCFLDPGYLAQFTIKL